MDNGRMQVGFEATFEELVDVHLRAAARSHRWRRTLASSVSTAALGATGFYLMSSFDPWVKQAGAAAFGVLLLVATPVYHRIRIRDWARKASREILGDRDTFPVQVRVGPDGLWSRNFGCELLLAWENVTSVEADGEDVVFWLKTRALSVVRARAFKTDAERSRFVELAERYIAERR